MEFSEKLQQLRKQSGLTQEQLAGKLFVSRTAVSKWESGRGYPNLESLKTLSGLFSVSIDHLLSNEELLQLAESEKRSVFHKVSGLVFGALDMMTAVFIFMPFFGEEKDGYIRSVSLPEYSGVSPFLKNLYFVFLILIALSGLGMLILEWMGYEKGLKFYNPCSLGLYVLAISLFVLSRQPYVAVLLFLIFFVKIIVLLQEKLRH